MYDRMRNHKTKIHFKARRKQMLYMTPCDDPSYGYLDRKEEYMEKLAAEAYVKLNGAVNYFFAAEFGRMLATSLKEGSYDAVTICERLDISEKHLAALLNDNAWFDEACNA